MGCPKLTYQTNLEVLKSFSPKILTSKKSVLTLRSTYIYGFNGKEQNSDIKNSVGSSYDYGFRFYDPRVARFLSVDPLTNDYPFYSPYQFAGNKPTIAIDIEGLEEFIVIGEPGTNIAANSTNTANVRAALQGQSATPGNTANLSNVQQVPNGQVVNVQTAIILWNPTARDINRNQGGMIQYQNVNSIGNQMRAMTPQEQADSYISARLAISSSSVEFARIIKGMEERRDNDGDGGIQTTSMSNGNRSAQLSNGSGEAIKFVIVTPPPFVNLNTNFNINSANINNAQQLNPALAPLANVFNNRQGATLTLTENANIPSSNPGTMNTAADMTQGELATARATSVGNILVQFFNVNPAQIQFAVGNVQGANGMTVQGQVNLQATPPNNGNRIDLE